MNQSLSTFLKIAVTVLAISAFLFYIGYNLIGTETGKYQNKIEGVYTNLPNGTGN